jgi:S-(hydroxymethyl)glutathione dehydrogenase/alcohol dehydrogenase
MKTTAAVLHETGKPLEIEELDLAGPQEGEILVRYTHAGLCHSDLHVMHGKIAGWLPMVLGHEGAGVVQDVGAGVTRVAPGDHIVCSFVPSCGSCHWCATGQQPLCDWGATTMRGYLPGEHWPLSGPAGCYGAMAMLGTFSQYGVIHQYSAVKINSELPLDVAALVGCAVPTGWGSAINAANVRPGQTVIVYGTGGVGINAVQGARFAGAKYVIAVDPVAFKRETALRLGATHTTGDPDEAHRMAQELTRGVGAHQAIVTVGTLTAEVIDQAFNAVGKAGTVVLTAVGGFRDRTIQLPAQVATLWKKTIKGSLFGECNPTADIPALLGLYQSGDLRLEELITARYRLEQINEGYEDMLGGRNIRGVIVHEHR